MLPGQAKEVIKRAQIAWTDMYILGLLKTNLLQVQGVHNFMQKKFHVFSMTKMKISMTIPYQSLLYD